jgi:protein TonB
MLLVQIKYLLLQQKQFVCMFHYNPITLMDLQSYCYQAHAGFEGRNQDYGAYAIRRDYASVVTRVLVFVIVGSGLIFAVPMLQRMLNPIEKVEERKEAVVEIFSDTPTYTDTDEKDEDNKKTQVVIATPQIENVKEIEYKEIDVTPEKPDTPELKNTADVLKDQGAISNRDSDGAAGDNRPEILEFNDNPNTDPGKGGTGIEDEDSKVYEPFQVAKEAEFPNGIDAFRAMVGKLIDYPHRAKKNETEGKVVLEVIIDKNGTISEVKIVRDIGDGCGEAAATAVKKIKAKWSPATNAQGKPVKQKKVLPIEFKLSK